MIGESLTLAKAARFQSLQACSGSTTSHSVGDAVSELMDNNVIFECSVTLRLQTSSKLPGDILLSKLTLVNVHKNIPTASLSD
jgi:hypothetical protein